MNSHEIVVPIVAMLIPIVFIVGLFASISMNIYFKYKTNSELSERLPHESLLEWHRANAQARFESHAKRGRRTGLRVGWLLAGIGIGTAIGCVILACGGVPDSTEFSPEAIGTFLVISLAMACGGAGMVGAYFIERRLDGKAK